MSYNFNYNFDYGFNVKKNNKKPYTPKIATSTETQVADTSTPVSTTHKTQSKPKIQHQQADKSRLPLPMDFYSRFFTLKGGSSEWMVCCPFHDDKTASMSINKTRGVFYCHACGVSGDIITFYQKKQNVDFVQACKELNLYN